MFMFTTVILPLIISAGVICTIPFLAILIVYGTIRIR